jgi:hypothetical protein
MAADLRNIPTARRAAFSFVEVLFAVMILGIGFIMLAGIFPVAISQTQTTGEENNAANIARSAVAYLEKLPATRQIMIADELTHRFAPDNPQDQTLWQMVKGNLVLPDDRRYAWVPFYRRGKQLPPLPPGTPIPPSATLPDSPYAQVIIIAVRCRNHSEYRPHEGPPPNAGDLFVVGGGPSAAATLTPIPVEVQFVASTTGGADIGTFSSASNPEFVKAVGPGAFVVVRQDTSPVHPVYPDSRAHGWVYRVGNNQNPDNPGNSWELAPANDLKHGGYKPTRCNAWIIGQGLETPGVVPGPTNPYIGGVQDVAVYSTYIQLK